jgi:probable HAF family extracellular repeat protein
VSTTPRNSSLQRLSPAISFPASSASHPRPAAWPRVARTFLFGTALVAGGALHDAQAQTLAPAAGPGGGAGAATYRVVTFGYEPGATRALRTPETGAPINASGDIVGYGSHNSAGYDFEAVVGRVSAQGVGSLTGLRALPGGPSWSSCCSSLATGINNAGQVVGYSWPTVGTPGREAFFADADGTLRPLGFLPGQTNRTSRYSMATALNEAGQVVGFASSNGAGGSPQAFITDANGAGGMRGLGFLPGAESGATNGAPAESRASAVNNAGRVVGFGRNAAGGYEAFITGPDGSDGLTGLGFLPGMSERSESYATAVNEAGRVVGHARAEGSRNVEAFITGDDPAGGLIRLNPMAGLSDVSSYAFGINASGHVVGFLSGMIGTTRRSGGFLWSAHDGMQWLEDLTIGGWHIVEASGINARGQIVATASRADSEGGAAQLVLLDPTQVPRATVPEPGTIVLSATGLLGVAALHRRRRA